METLWFQVHWAPKARSTCLSYAHQTLPSWGTPTSPQQNVALACLFAIPAHTSHDIVGIQSTSHTRVSQRDRALSHAWWDDSPWQLWLTSVNLPLDSRSVDPHSTPVWCGNLLHSSPQPHMAEVQAQDRHHHTATHREQPCSGLCATPLFHSMEYSLLQPRSAPKDTPVRGNPNRLSLVSHALSTR